MNFFLIKGIYIQPAPMGDDIYINVPDQNDGQATRSNIIWSGAYACVSIYVFDLVQNR